MIRALLLLLLLTACGRPLTENERAYLSTIHGTSVDYDRVRLHDGAPTRAVTFTRKPRPRTTCRERILPPQEGDSVTSKPAAVALFNNVLFDKDWYLEDYLPDHPDRIGLIAAMLLAHEITHVWQWQNRAQTGYTPLRSASEHSRSDDPYLFDIATSADFLDYGFEQQASIVEEYVCCATLDPEAPRTKRMASMLRGAFPMGKLHIPEKVRIPWKDAEIENICR